MSLFQAAILGIVQGLTEFLPISSSGHLIFLPKLFGWVDQGQAFDVVVHLGTLVAVVIYFRKKLFDIAKSFVLRGVDSEVNRRLGLLLVLSIIPAGLIGFFGNEWIEEHTRSAAVIAWGFIVWGIVLLLADRFNKKVPQTQLVDLHNLNWKKIAVIGTAQAIALIPGTSRSGITMTAGLFSKLDKKSAAEFSFLMSVPIIAIAGTMKVIDLVQEGLGVLTVGSLVVGLFASALSGFFAIAGLLKIIQKWSFMPFVVYRIVMGVLILMFL